MAQRADRCRVFRQLHQSRCFVIPNSWDVGSARLLAQPGFPALATTSSGFAWLHGVPDNGVSLEETLLHLGLVSHGVDVPVNADFEGGFAIEPDAVGANVAAATTTGIAGLSIEDSTREATSPLFEFSLASEIAEHETFTNFARAVPFAQINESFPRERRDRLSNTP